MFLLIAIFAGLLAAVTQIGMAECEFVVKENNLIINEDGMVEGKLRLGYLGKEYDSQWPYECSMSRVDCPSLINVRPDSVTSIRYRAKALGPFKKQEPCAIFLRRLGVKPDEIDGYVFLKYGTDVVINGRQ
jgi:hypothetical protein